MPFDDSNPANNAPGIIRSQICTISSSEKITEVQKANPHLWQKDFPKESSTMTSASSKEEPLESHDVCSEVSSKYEKASSSLPKSRLFKK